MPTSHENGYIWTTAYDVQHILMTENILGDSRWVNKEQN